MSSEYHPERMGLPPPCVHKLRFSWSFSFHQNHPPSMKSSETKDQARREKASKAPFFPKMPSIFFLCSSVSVALSQLWKNFHPFHVDMSVPPSKMRMQCTLCVASKKISLLFLCGAAETDSACVHIWSWWWNGIGHTNSSIFLVCCHLISRMIRRAMARLSEKVTRLQACSSLSVYRRARLSHPFHRKRTFMR